MSDNNNILDNLDLSGKTNSSNFDYLEFKDLLKNAAVIQKNLNINVAQCGSKKKFRNEFRAKFVDNTENFKKILSASDKAIIEKFNCAINNPLVFRNK